jgi:hypothetical protein
VLLGTLDEGLYVLRFKELYELVLRQRSVSVLSNLIHECDKLTECMTVFWLFPADPRLHSCHKLVNVHALECYSVAEASAVHGRTSRSPSAHFT